MEFKCSGCGCCCKRVDTVIKLVENSPLLKFPYSHVNGVCEMLSKDNKCLVYNKRPLICNVDEVSKLFNLDKKAYYEASNLACNKMMDEDGIDLSLRI